MRSTSRCGAPKSVDDGEGGENLGSFPGHADAAAGAVRVFFDVESQLLDRGGEGTFLQFDAAQVVVGVVAGVEDVGLLVDDQAPVAGLRQHPEAVGACCEPEVADCQSAAGGLLSALVGAGT